MKYRYVLYFLLSTPLLALPPTPSFQKKAETHQQQHRVVSPKKTTQHKKGSDVVIDYQSQKEQLEQDFQRSLPAAKVAKAHYKQHTKEDTNIVQTTQPKKPFWKTVTISDMDYHELLQRKKELVKAGDYAMAIKYIEQLFKRAENPDQIVYIMLEWGALLMATDDYARAETMYRDFIKLYPGNQYAELAFVRAIECSWYQTTTHERDQTKTEETLRLIQEFYTRKDLYDASNVNHIDTICQQCYAKLATHNMHIAKQYINLSRYRSAHKRIDVIKTVDLVRLPDIEPELLHIELMLAQAEHNSDIEKQKLTELSTKFPDHAVTLAAVSPEKSWFMSLFA